MAKAYFLLTFFLGSGVGYNGSGNVYIAGQALTRNCNLSVTKVLEVSLSWFCILLRPQFSALDKSIPSMAYSQQNLLSLHSRCTRNLGSKVWTSVLSDREVWGRACVLISCVHHSCAPYFLRNYMQATVAFARQSSYTVSNRFPLWVSSRESTLFASTSSSIQAFFN